jgi:hypothetical protein
MTMLSRLALSVVLWGGLAVLALPAQAQEVTRSLGAPIDRVWEVTRAVLKQQGWEIDKEDRTIGWITTKPRRVEGEEYGVYMKGTVHKLVLHEKDEPVTVTDRDVEKALLAAIEKSL